MTFLDKAKSEKKEKGITFLEDGLPVNCPFNYGYEEDYNCVGTNCDVCWNREMPKTETKEDAYKEDMHTAYNKGLNDAWEFFKKIWNSSIPMITIFGADRISYLLDNFTPQEALAKLKAYEEKRNIEVGDIVLIYGEEAVVTRVVDEHANILFRDGVTNNMPVKELVGDKTGKHIEIKKFLEAIGE